MYLWEQPDWPHWRWQDALVDPRLTIVRHKQGRLLGRMEAIGFAAREDASLRALTLDVLKTSAIEGESLDRSAVRSSIARRLGIEIGALASVDRAVEGIVEVTLDATRNCAEPLTKARLFAWQRALIPAADASGGRVAESGWRQDKSGPMQVVSGPIGRERVHYQAPPASWLEREMAAFLRWFNAPPRYDSLTTAALAHLWFVTVHPFEDGNGRIARAIADLSLARGEGTSQRFYSMSAQIRAERSAYYRELERAQRGSLDVTRWLAWFLGCLERAIDGASETLATVLSKAAFWQEHATAQLNGRQVQMLNALLDGFRGNLTSSKWALLTKCSQDTAARDIGALLALGILRKGPAGGRSTSYQLVRE